MQTGIEKIAEKLKELYYNHEPHLYIKMRSWSQEQLAERKAKIVYWMHTLHAHYGEAAGDSYNEGSAIAILECQYHDIDEEQDCRLYYLENPSPSRKEFAIRHGLDVTNLK